MSTILLSYQRDCCQVWLLGSQQNPPLMLILNGENEKALTSLKRNQWEKEKHRASKLNLPVQQQISILGMSQSPRKQDGSRALAVFCRRNAWPEIQDIQAQEGELAGIRSEKWLVSPVGWDPEGWRRLSTQVTQVQGDNISKLASI